MVGKVIGEVLDMYNPVAEFTVHYGSKQIANGCEIKPSAAAQKPHVHILGSRLSSDLYTLVSGFQLMLINQAVHKTSFFSLYDSLI